MLLCKSFASRRSGGGSFPLQFQQSTNTDRNARLLRDTTPLQRGIIRHMVLILDFSFAMVEKDLVPTRYLITLRYSVSFVHEYFEQNPISQLGIIGMRDGIAVRVSDMSGNPAEHIERLRALEKQDPQGNPSLQNALEMSRAMLYHTPSHGTREVLIIYGALLSSDPGDIHDTISSLITDRIRVSIIGLAAQVAICAELCSKTNHGEQDKYNVCLHEQHLRELFMRHTTPPITQTKEQSQSSLLMMGFPSRTTEVGGIPSFCACHGTLTRNGYLCSRCETKVCNLPAECPACGLTLILSTHLARSYHHLFPLRNWVEVPWSKAGTSKVCFSCLTSFPDVPSREERQREKDGDRGGGKVKGMSESGRYACEVCGRHFCIDCDVFAHEVVHNCPGCQADTRGVGAKEVNGKDVVMGNA
jgi:transcription initiation factor TFIIH subunit 2